MISVIVYTIEVKSNEKGHIVLLENNKTLVEILIFIFLNELLVFVLIYGYNRFKNKLIKKKEASTIAKLRIYGEGLFWLFSIVFIIIILIADTYRLEIVYVEYLAPLYFLALCAFGIYWLFKQIKSIINLRNEKVKAEVLHLQSQVNPHFFFNILNNLYGLVKTDADKAQELILKLSNMMRYSIYDGQKNLVTLEEEIDYLKNYIELHKMRYHKKIEVDCDFQVQEKEYKVMPLLFIILLENAFKHGVENLRKNAYVKVNLTTIENEIRFSVENNFDSTELTSQPGIGLKNLKRRLELVYPKKHSLSYSITEDVYTALLILKLT
ncbi:sensor histidine kinase [Flavobacteriaceae bacterium R38]|nr:sensor histidine kinase [Flavobacteriaceae bacterium R38]